MRLLILGASGGCGRALTQLAHSRGHDVAALIRHGSDIDIPSDVRIHRGDVLDTAVLNEIIPGHDAVLCALGLRRNGRSPWARLQSPPDLMQRVSRMLTDAMPRAGVQRLVAISAAGVGQAAPQCSLPVRWLIGSGNIAVAYRDLDAMEAVLAASDLDWMVVQPVTLLHGPARRAARQVERYRLHSTIRRSEVATFMLNAVEQPQRYPQRRLMIGR